MTQSSEIRSNFKSCMCVYVCVYETYKIQAFYQPAGPASLAAGMENNVCLYCYIIIKSKSISDKSCRP